MAIFSLANFWTNSGGGGWASPSLIKITCLAAASLFTLINVAGAVQAVASGEGLHTAAHVGLAILGAYFVWRLVQRPRQQQDLSSGRPTVERIERIERLQLSVDAIALEVERIGEAQRYIAKLAEEENLDAMRPPLDGHQVMQRLGMTQGGPVVGEALAYLMEVRLERGPVSEAEALELLDTWASERGLSG